MDELTQRGQKEKGKRSKYPGRSKEKRKAHGRKHLAGSYLAKEDDAHTGGEEDLIYRTN
jgi:hypothetical protein